MKSFTLYSTKYKKRVSNLRRGKMPLFTALSFRTPKSAENLKIFSINSRTSAQCKFYIRFMYYIRPLKETTTHLLMFPNKDTPCGGENECTRERSRDVPDVVDKKEIAFPFVLYKILDIL